MRLAPCRQLLIVLVMVAQAMIGGYAMAKSGARLDDGSTVVQCEHHRAGSPNRPDHDNAAACDHCTLCGVDFTLYAPDAPLWEDFVRPVDFRSSIFENGRHAPSPSDDARQARAPPAA